LVETSVLLVLADAISELLRLVSVVVLVEAVELGLVLLLDVDELGLVVDDVVSFEAVPPMTDVVEEELAGFPLVSFDFVVSVEFDCGVVAVAATPYVLFVVLVVLGLVAVAARLDVSLCAVVLLVDG
jgi:hypothetical protein